MPLTLDTTMPTFNQNPPRELVPDQFRGARLRAALLEVSGQLRCRPEPRAMWDDLGRADRELRSLWIDKDVEMCRDALIAAAGEGQHVLDQTIALVERYFAEKLSSTLYGFSSLAVEDLQREIRDLQREIADVQVAAAETSYQASESSIEHLREEALEVRPVIDGVIALTSARLARRPARLART